MNWKNPLHVLCFTTFFFFPSCKKNQSSNKTASNASPVVASVGSELKQLQNQHLDFNTEYQNFSKAVATYRASSAFTDPQNDNQKTMNILSEMLNSLVSDPSSQQELEQKILNHSFVAYNQVYANIDSYQAQIAGAIAEAQSMVAQNPNKDTPPIVSTPSSTNLTPNVPQVPPQVTTLNTVQTLTTANTQTVNTLNTQTLNALNTKTVFLTNTKTVPDIQVATTIRTVTQTGTSSTGTQSSELTVNPNVLLAGGIAVFILAGLGVAHAAKQIGGGIQSARKNGAKITFQRYTDNFIKNFTRDSGTFLKIGFLVMMSVLITEGFVQNGTIASEDLKDPILVLGGLGAMTAIYWTFELAINKWNKGLTGQLIVDEHGYSMDKAGNIRNKYGNLILDTEGHIYLDKDTSYRWNKNQNRFEQKTNFGTWAPLGNPDMTIIGQWNMKEINPPNHLLFQEKSGLYTDGRDIEFKISKDKVEITPNNLNSDHFKAQSGKYYNLDIMDSLFGNRGLVWKAPTTKFLGKDLPKFTQKSWFQTGKTLAGILSAGALAAGSIFTYATQLNLADTSQNESPDAILLAAVNRFYAACQLLSTAGTLVLN